MRGPTPFSMDSVVVGRSAKMRAVFDFVHVVGESDSSVLITGESGTGKEVVANIIHASSLRRHRPFVPVSCALFSETLIESELFGHERGSFTGAIRERLGRFELAQGGTLFLDDIDDVPIAMQVKLLRVLQNRTVERVGGQHAIPVDVRVIAGTKRNLKQLVEGEKFREDLYYRLNVLPIVLPPLREHREDIPILMDHFISRYFRLRGVSVPEISPVARQAFMRYSWPGNIRELENTCERIAQICTCGTVRIGCIAPSVLFHADVQDPSPAVESAIEMVERPEVTAPPAARSLDDRLREVESNLIGWALRVSDGNRSQAARLLKIKRSTLGDRINRCRLSGHRVDAPLEQTTTSATPG